MQTNYDIYSVPSEVIFGGMFLNCTAKDIVSYARTDRRNYQEFMGIVKGLWGRTVACTSNELSQAPWLPLLRLIDGFQRLSSNILLFEKHKGLFNAGYMPLGSPRAISRDLEIYKSRTIKNFEEKLCVWGKCSFLRSDDILVTPENQVKADLRRAMDLENQIFKSKALVVLNLFAGLFDIRSLCGFVLLLLIKDLNMSIWMYVALFLGFVLKTVKNMEEGNTSKILLNRVYNVGCCTASLAVILMYVSAIKSYFS